MADIESEDHALTNSMFFFVFSFRLESVSPYLARQFAPYARTLIDEYIQGSSEMDELEEEEGEDLEIDENGDVIELESEGDVELKQPADLLDADGNKVYSAEQVEELLARCLAAISNRDSISSRYSLQSCVTWIREDKMRSNISLSIDLAVTCAPKRSLSTHQCIHYYFPSLPLPVCNSFSHLRMFLFFCLYPFFCL